MDTAIGDVVLVPVSYKFCIRFPSAQVSQM